MIKDFIDEYFDEVFWVVFITVVLGFIMLMTRLSNKVDHTTIGTFEYDNTSYTIRHKLKFNKTIITSGILARVDDSDFQPLTSETADKIREKFLIELKLLNKHKELLKSLEDNHDKVIINKDTTKVVPKKLEL